ncbi:MAG: hypothetical protein QW735_03765 [archaeon]
MREKGDGKMVGLGKEEIKWAVLGAWEIVINGVKKEEKKMLKIEEKENKWNIESRSKIKSINTALFEYEDPSAGLLHFVKYAEYMLPRSNLNSTLNVLLKKVAEVRKMTNDAAAQREMISHLVGYLCWSLDAFCKVLEDSNASQNVENARNPLKNMFEAEFSVISIPEEKKNQTINQYLDELIKWAKDSIRDRR